MTNSIKYLRELIKTSEHAPSAIGLYLCILDDIADQVKYNTTPNAQIIEQLCKLGKLSGAYAREEVEQL